MIAPFTLRFIIEDDGPRFDACSADTDAARNRIVAAAREAGLEGIALCTVGLGVPSTRWAEAAEQVIRALKEIGQGSVTMSNADITLIASDTTPQEVFDRVVGELENDLPDVFALHSVLPEPVEIDGTGDSVTTPEFVATKSPEGLVQLRGRITDQRARDALESFAKARFGTANVSPATRLDGDLPEGWPMRVLAGARGAVAAEQRRRGRAARVRQPARRDRRPDGPGRDLAPSVRAAGRRRDYELDITYDEALDPIAALPTPEECVQTINAAMAERKITFEPGSTEIEEGALETLDQIADLLPECQHVSMEIGGHTDSQGREEMNLNLSQSRADAVLNAILARRVLISNLTAQGYGEDAAHRRQRHRRGPRGQPPDRVRALLDEAADGGEEGEAAGPTTQRRRRRPKTPRPPRRPTRRQRTQTRRGRDRDHE